MTQQNLMFAYFKTHTHTHSPYRDTVEVERHIESQRRHSFAASLQKKGAEAES